MSKLVAVSASAALLGVLAFGTPADAGQRERSDIRNIDQYEFSSQQRVRRERVAERRAVRRDRRAVRRDRRMARRDSVSVGVHAGAYTPFLGYRAAAYPGYRPAYVWDFPLFAATSIAFLPFAAMGGTLDTTYAQAPAGEPVVRAMY
jgi:hypothetical protein